MRQHGHADQPGCAEGVRRQDARAIADAIYKPRRKIIDQQLNAEIERDQQGDARQRDGKLLLENQKQQRSQIIDDRLGDIAQLACADGVLIGKRPAHKSPSRN